MNLETLWANLRLRFHRQENTYCERNWEKQKNRTSLETKSEKRGRYFGMYNLFKNSLDSFVKKASNSEEQLLKMFLYLCSTDKSVISLCYGQISTCFPLFSSQRKSNFCFTCVFILPEKTRKLQTVTLGRRENFQRLRINGAILQGNKKSFRM